MDFDDEADATPLGAGQETTPDTPDATISGSPADLQPRRRKGLPRNGRWPKRVQKDGTRENGHLWALSGRWKRPFVDIMAQCGNLTAACDGVGVSRNAYLKARKDDPEFAEALEDAHQRFLDGLEYTLLERVMEGEWRYVLDKDGVRRKVNKNKSDILLMFLLKKWIPPYKDGYQGEQQEATGKAVAQAIIQVLGIPQDGVMPLPLVIETHQEKVARLERELTDAKAMCLADRPQPEALDANG